MMFQAGILVSFAVMTIGGSIYYFNEEYPERVAYTRLGLGLTLLGLVMLVGTMVFLREPVR